MHASLARERYHRARADADVGQRAAVKTYEELGGFAPALAQPRNNSQEAQDVEDEHGRYSLDRIRDLVSFTPECFLRLYRSFPVFSGALLKSGADGAIGDGPEEGGSQSPPSSERVSCEQSACYLCFPVIEFERARGSRIGQRPLSTWTMKSPAERLNSSGSSRLMVWPQFGITASAAEAMFCFIRMPGLRQGQSSSPCRMSVGTESRRISSTRSYSDGRFRCTPSWVFAEPTAECCASMALNSAKPRGSLFSNCTRVGPKAYFSANASMPEERRPAAMTSASARKRSRSSGAAP